MPGECLLARQQGEYHCYSLDRIHGDEILRVGKGYWKVGEMHVVQSGTRNDMSMNDSLKSHWLDNTIMRTRWKKGKGEAQ